MALESDIFDRMVSNAIGRQEDHSMAISWRFCVIGSKN